jgi:tetratricopeptide (TPR) repeat protein
MTSTRWDLIKSIYASASEQPAETRAGFLRDRCAGDDELRGEVESLLEWNQRGEIMFAQPAATIGSLLESDDPPIPGNIGPWRVLREIGSGGMGTVYLAQRDDGVFEQQVAIKIMRFGIHSRGLLKRFCVERRILAGLDHPNIARILDGGELPSAQPYLVMEYVEGEPLDAYCRKRDLSVPDRLRIFLDVCDAVGYAHRHLIVHRDLKPANILVCGNATPKLLDFGVAKMLDADDAGIQGAGVDGALTTGIMLTPAYASPEQVRGEPAVVASDIYSLGVILYELLAGTRPYEVHQTSPLAIARAVCETEAQPPSLAAPAHVRSRIAGDLDNITMLALRKDSERRYASVEALVLDIRNHLEGRPVSARRDTAAYRLGKFIRRNRIAVAGGILALCAVAGGVIAAIEEARIAQRRFEDGHRLARSLLFEVYDTVEQLPGSTGPRDLIAKRAVEYLDGLARQSHNDIELKRDLANGYIRFASVEGHPGSSSLGYVRNAEENYRKAIALLEQIIAQRPDDLSARGSLAATYASLSGTVQDRQQSLDLAWKSLHMAQECAARWPEVWDVKSGLASAHYTVARALTSFDRFEDALTQYREALPVYKSRSAADPNDREAQRNVALTLKRIGALLWKKNKLEDALAQYEQARVIDEKQVAATPESMGAKLDLSFDYTDAGMLRNLLGDPHGGLNLLRRALELRRAAFGADPKDVRAQTSLVSSLKRIAYLERRTGDLNSALLHITEAHRITAVRAAASQTAPSDLAEMADIELDWSIVLASKGACTEARQRLADALRIIHGLEAKSAWDKTDPALNDARESMKACDVSAGR